MNHVEKNKIVFSEQRTEKHTVPEIVENRQRKEENHFFEGVEKLLEVWFTAKSGKTESCDLRNIPR